MSRIPELSYPVVLRLTADDHRPVWRMTKYRCHVVCPKCQTISQTRYEKGPFLDYDILWGQLQRCVIADYGAICPACGHWKSWRAAFPYLGEPIIIKLPRGDRKRARAAKAEAEKDPETDDVTIIHHKIQLLHPEEDEPEGEVISYGECLERADEVAWALSKNWADECQ